MEAATRDALIDRLDRSLEAMPGWQQFATKDHMARELELPSRHPQTGEPLKDFREVAAFASDKDLEKLRDDFKENRTLAADTYHHTVPTREEIATERFERHLDAAVEYAKFEITGDYESLSTALDIAERAGVNREEKSALLKGIPDLAVAFDNGLARNGLPEKYTITYEGKSKVDVYHDAQSAAKAFVHADHRDRPQVIGEMIGSDRPILLAKTDVKESGRLTDFAKVVQRTEFGTQFSQELRVESVRTMNDPSKALAVTIPTNEPGKERTFER